MAENETRDSNIPGPEDLMPVASRVSWGAILAGAVLAMAVYMVLTLLGIALGLSVTREVRTENLAVGGAIWAVISTIIALFIGGWVTSQCTVGENKLEAAVHGVVMWGVVFALFIMLVAAGVWTGFGAMVGMSTFVGTPGGVPSADVNTQEALNMAQNAAWWTLGGVVLSLASAIGGGLLGAGPSPRLLALRPGGARIWFSHRQTAGRA